MDSASPFNTNGLPFVLTQMSYQGHAKGALAPAIDSLFQGIGADVDDREANLKKLQMPLTLDIIRFK